MARITVEDCLVHIPNRFQLVLAANPCPCGQLGNAQKACRCTPDAVLRYQSRISGPLLDRIDLHIEVPAVAPSRLGGSADGETSAVVSIRVATSSSDSTSSANRIRRSLPNWFINTCEPL